MTPWLLNVGCGPRGTPIPALFSGYREVRMDIDPAVEPDLIGSLTQTFLPDGVVDAVLASHVLEHVEQWDVQTALKEIWRVLRPGGQALFVVPDLARVAQEIAAHPDGIETVTAAAPFGATPLDMLFGYQPAVFAGQDSMRHRTAFTAATLSAHLQAAGFVRGKVTESDWQLWALVQKGDDDDEERQ